MTGIVLDTIAPLFGIVLFGYLAGRLRLLARESSGSLSQFVFNIALPAMIFVKLSSLPIEEFFDWSFIGALGGGMFLMMCLSMVVGRTFFGKGLTGTAFHSLASMFSSTAYIGLPVILILFGDAGLAPGIIGAVITGVVFLPIGIVLAEIDQSGGFSGASLKPLGSVILNPAMAATGAGLIVAWQGVLVPAPVVTLCELLGAAFIPCALFAAGLYVTGSVRQLFSAEVYWLVVAKLLLHPAITWVLAFHVFDLDRTLATIAVLQAALPAGIPVFVLAQNYGVFEGRANSAIVLSTVLSFVTLSIAMLVLDL